MDFEAPPPVPDETSRFAKQQEMPAGANTFWGNMMGSEVALRTKNVRKQISNIKAKTVTKDLEAIEEVSNNPWGDMFAAVKPVQRKDGFEAPPSVNELLGIKDDHSEAASYT